VGERLWGDEGALSTSTRELCVPEWSALFEGHFEGAPILSGVSQLFLLQQILGSLLPGKELRAMERLRFKATTGPRDWLRFEVQGPSDSGQVRVAVHHDSQLVLQGVLRVC
jgi:3-hydroxymyristoyl/3-hydroxydecanoyl-(acyl carrier protein) dehydratase